MNAALSKARALVATIPDPELPVVTLADLGILRSVEQTDAGGVVVTITPTYSGCPAMAAIRSEIVTRLQGGGFENVEVRTSLQPAWTTDWISDEGRAKLRSFGIAPPAPRDSQLLQLTVSCPHCGSASTRLVSRFGSTACKALRVCNSCAEPFDHFKPL